MPAHATLYEAVTLAAKANPSKIAVTIPDGPQLSHSQYVQAIKDFQRELALLNIPQQAAISIAIPNNLEFAISFLGVAFSSYIAAPLNPAYKKSEFAFYIDDLKSALVLVPKDHVKNNSPAVQAARDFGAGIAEIYWDDSSRKLVLDLKETGSIIKVTPGATVASTSVPPAPASSHVALVLHTSGTTGRPKAVPLTQKNMATTVFNIINTYKLTPADTSYLVMPLFHVHGLLAGFLAPLASGGAVVIPPRFSAQSFWSDFITYKANWYTAVPTIHQILLKGKIPSPLPKIRFIRSCSSSLAPATFEALEETFKAPVLEAYAMTEACHQMTSNNLPPGKRKPGTVGVGQGVEVVILDANDNILPAGQEGEISIKGPNVTPGYINNPKANAESFTKNGYFRTGDQGKKDEDGFVIITGRIKELINRGGEKISPIELDGVMLRHPDVSEAVAFAAPNELYGQVVNAAIVLKPSAENKDHKALEKDIQQFLSTKLAKFKIPERIFFTKIMPKTATGKIQRRIVAQKFLETPKPKL
ncbi:uncharacterized protein SAPINGB_P001906 [Magnusiomyces paraingens]|uniref:Peroxisomal-coenzyme A synthetase n=1 Tax=Magnusiomyces paraingens TaxID=2606893 RepID=A0A5E8BGT6_9ASCO|nr:uncharacterized protein SAPINGB_P001906 [Saprochaete ingens]VVT48696.1 unnamed protein product [Saprochaete ingens]